MKKFKIISVFFVAGIMIQCASSQKIDKEAPVTIKDPYFQKWVGGIEEAGSGFDIYLPVEKNTTVTLEHAYFKGKKIKLAKSNNGIYIGRYKDPNAKRDLIMSDDPQAEFKNKIPVPEEEIPFELKGNACIVSYNTGGTIGFFKLDDIEEKKVKAMPMRIRQ